MATDAQRDAFVRDNSGLFSDLYIDLIMTLQRYGIRVEHSRDLQSWVNKMQAVIVTEIASPADQVDDDEEAEDEEEEEEAEADSAAGKKEAAPLPTADGKAPVAVEESD